MMPHFLASTLGREGARQRQQLMERLISSLSVWGAGVRTPCLLNTWISPLPVVSHCQNYCKNEFYNKQFFVNQFFIFVWQTVVSAYLRIESDCKKIEFDSASKGGSKILDTLYNEGFVGFDTFKRPQQIPLAVKNFSPEVGRLPLGNK